MKKSLIIAFALILILPGFIFSDVVSFKVGYFIPRAMSDLWDIEFENMDFTKSEFQNTNFAFAYEYFVSRELSVVLNIEGYTRNKSGLYRDFVGEYIDDYGYAFDYGQGFPITHSFSVAITPVQVSLKLTPLGRKGKLIPYIGGGVGAYLWSVRLTGDMIDFESGEWFYDIDLDEDVIGYPLYQVDAREENRLNFGFHVIGGIMLPVANRISLEGEVKYHHLKAAFKDAFLGFDPFDLSGITITLGMNYWF